ncbi:MAG: hypothetical protein JXQ91_14300 [Vannielia sp.]|uniref:hypothetical protein n=1 Tax=Vannielia sp. TaxID=2813045 RepID=UPI003B8BB387
MKTLVKTALILVALGLAFCALAPASRAEAKSCGGNGQQACAAEAATATQCAAWLHAVGGTCRPCGGEGLNACQWRSADMACHAGLANHFGRCIRVERNAISPAGFDLSQIFGGNRADKLRWAATQYTDMIADLAAETSATLPAGRAAADLVTALDARDGETAKRILAADPALRASFDKLRAMGFNTVTLGLQTRNTNGTLLETGFSLDLALAWTPRLYTTASVGAATSEIGRAELVFTFHKSGNTGITGEVYGAAVPTSAGQTTEMVMWFTENPFDFTGFSLGLATRSLWANGSVSFASTKLWN